jgi:hypothetical protein
LDGEHIIRCYRIQRVSQLGEWRQLHQDQFFADHRIDLHRLNCSERKDVLLCDHFGRLERKGKPIL